MPKEAHAHFVVGVETEAPLAVWALKKTKKKDKHGKHIKENRLLEGLTEAVEEVAERFNKAGLVAYGDTLDAGRNHSKWGITIDSSIEKHRGELRGIGTPIEIKSPPMNIATSNYKKDFRTMWDIIGPMMVPDVHYWKLANNNIHFSLTKWRHFPLEPAQKLAFCIVYFEKGIDDIIPGNPHKDDGRRRGGWKHCNEWTKRNRVVPSPDEGLPLDDLPSCWAWIRQTKDIKQLSKLICYDSDRYRRDHDNSHKNWKWNFKGLGYKTIEFRHMPPTRSAQETLDWITFTTEFITAATKVDTEELDKAMKTEISFREALGLSGTGESREEEIQKEAVWARDNGGQLTYTRLQEFMIENSQAKESLFRRLIRVRDQLEDELKALPPFP
ncbi:hypothetical protein HD806DRAFT_534454 [Xylariaceae sp. AK1471]|nr:hypothetical protein HD806DRAFT_534454 [Xylariaceae sp. AK1471]